MVKRVYKYGTGHDIPEGAVYLSTITEDIWKEECVGHCSHSNNTLDSGTPEKRRFIESRFVWHYFLVDVDEKS